MAGAGTKTSGGKGSGGAIVWIAGLALLLAIAIGMAFMGTSFAQVAALPADAVKTMKAGSGPVPGPTDTVSVRYVGRLTDGTVFDQSPPGQTVDFPLNRVVPGFSQGIQRMREGEKARITIPAALGYGAQGTPGGPIPPNADLVFDVDLVKVTKAQ